MSLLAEAAGKDTGTYMELSKVLPTINAAPQVRELYKSILESLNVSTLFNYSLILNYNILTKS